MKPVGTFAFALCVVGVLVVSSGAAVLAQIPDAAPPDGKTLFDTSCRSCHTGAAGSRAPSPDSLAQRAPRAIIDALTAGAMRYQGFALSGPEKRAIAEFLSGRKMEGDPSGATTGHCSATVPFSARASGGAWNGWSPTPENAHFQSAEQAGLSVDQVQQLKLKWAFGFPDVTIAWSQPSVVGGRVFVGSQGGFVYALDAKSGCIHWVFTAKAGVRTAISVGARSGGGYAAYFSDMNGNVYAVDAAAGNLLWTRDIEDHPTVRLTATLVLYEGTLYVPVSSFEEGLALSPANQYPCCTFRGKVVALDAETGSVKWTTYMVDEPQPLGKTPEGVPLWGPSGGAIWSTPAIDPKRRLLYVATGNSYSAPPQPTTDAIVALELATGKVRWARQVTPNDVFGCQPAHPNCIERGPDFDFGAAPLLVTRPDGKDVIIAGQKSGVGYALDPDDDGHVVWQYRAGKGDAVGGIVWGTAADDQNAYFPVSDQRSPQPGGLHAVNLVTGDRVWAAPPAPLACGASGPGCSGAQSAAITVIPGIVFSGSIDGALRAYSTKDGTIIWQTNTNREFDTVNGVPAKGASLIGPGPTVVDGMVYVNSGYGAYGGRPGNVLLAFGVQ